MKKAVEKTSKEKLYTANEIWSTYEYLDHKSMLQEGSYPKGTVKEWGKQFKEFSKKRFVCIDEIKEMPKKKFADVRIDAPN